MGNRLSEWIRKKTAKMRSVGETPPLKLTPSASRESLLISAAAATAKSPFFQKLPFEVRHSILEHAFAGYTFHLVAEPLEYIPPRSKRLQHLTLEKERLWCSVCPALDSLRASREGLRPYGQWCTCWDEGFGSSDVGVMGWLLSCRQAYAECINILYAQNTMHMRSDIIGRLPTMIIPERLSSITSVEFRYVGYRFSMLKSSISETHERILLYSFLRDLLATIPRLKKLYLSIDGIMTDGLGAVYESISEVLEQNLMVPLDDMLQKFDPLLEECNITIQVTSWRPDHVWPRQSSHFQGHWIRNGKKNIPFGDKSPSDTCDESLTLHDLQSPSYTLKAVPEFAP